MDQIRSIASQTVLQLEDRRHRFVFFAPEDIQADWYPGTDGVATTSLSRARFITAVAVAAGRKSPEVEMGPMLPVAATRAEISRDDAIREGRLILLAEDHPVNRDVILRQLRQLGYAADAVEDGIQALHALACNRYGLLLTDCNMPRMDGFELVRSLREIEVTGTHLPVIALTANALEGEDKRCLSAGMDDYLSKPVKLATLQGRLEYWLSGRTSPPLSPDTQERSPLCKEPPLSLAVLAEFCGDDPQILLETLERYVLSLRSDLKNLRAAIDSNDATNVEVFAHRMKGAARTVGGIALARCSEALEHSARARDWPAISRDLPLLSEAVTMVDRMYNEVARR
jgi:CheY-like chemotaxis protein